MKRGRGEEAYHGDGADAVGDDNVWRISGDEFQEAVDGVALVEVVHGTRVVMHDDIQDLPRLLVYWQRREGSVSAETQQPVGGSKKRTKKEGRRGRVGGITLSRSRSPS